MKLVAVVFHSGFGHTRRQAEAVIAGIDTVPGCSSVLVDVSEMGDPEWAAIEGADAMVLGAPTYMGSASAPFKAFMDATSRRWFQTAPMQNKLAAAFTCSASQTGDKSITLHQLFAFAMQLRMIWVGLGLPPGNNSSKGSIEDLNRLGSFEGVMAQANADQGPDVAPPESDLRTAAHLGARVARAALAFDRAAFAHRRRRRAGRAKSFANGNDVLPIPAILAARPSSQIAAVTPKRSLKEFKRCETPFCLPPARSCWRWSPSSVSARCSRPLRQQWRPSRSTAPMPACRRAGTATRSAAIWAAV